MEVEPAGPSESSCKLAPSTSRRAYVPDQGQVRCEQDQGQPQDAHQSLPASDTEEGEPRQAAEAAGGNAAARRQGAECPHPGGAHHSGGARRPRPIGRRSAALDSPARGA
eukprot:scaffold5696_cov119-Isochrysis_galbana.AAC.12